MLGVGAVIITPVLEIRVRSACPRLKVHLGPGATAAAREGQLCCHSPEHPWLGDAVGA